MSTETSEATSGLFRRSAHQGFPFAPGFLGFGWAYKEAALALSKTLGTTEIVAWWAAAPIVFLYRHALEMHLKGLLIDYGRHHGITRDNVIKRSHRLAEHIPDLRTVAECVSVEITPSLEEYIRDMDARDPSSVTFRYPEDRSGGTPTGGLDGIDIRHFVSQSETALAELTDIAFALECEYVLIMKDELGFEWDDDATELD